MMLPAFRLLTHHRQNGAVKKLIGKRFLNDVYRDPCPPPQWRVKRRGELFGLAKDQHRTTRQSKDSFCDGAQQQSPQA